MTEDSEIRAALHRKVLYRHHCRDDSLVVDELGLAHGTHRADIAVINGHLMGFEIKSDKDTLARLAKQIPAYEAVFDWSTAVVGERHLDVAMALLPQEWGVVLAYRNSAKAISFKRMRSAARNRNIDAFSVAQLLWRNEAHAILSRNNTPRAILRKPRSVLYSELVRLFPPAKLCRLVRECLRNRENWRHPVPPSPGGGLCPPSAM